MSSLSVSEECLLHTLCKTYEAAHLLQLVVGEFDEVATYKVLQKWVRALI